MWRRRQPAVGARARLGDGRARRDTRPPAYLGARIDWHGHQSRRRGVRPLARGHARLASPTHSASWLGRIAATIRASIGQLLTSPARPDGHLLPATSSTVCTSLVPGCCTSARPVTPSGGSVTCRLGRATISPRQCRQRHGSASSSSSGPTCSQAYKILRRWLAEQFGHQTCGLALEHLLQVTYRPVLSARRRSGTGNGPPDASTSATPAAPSTVTSSLPCSKLCVPSGINSPRRRARNREPGRSHRRRPGHLPGTPAVKAGGRAAARGLGPASVHSPGQAPRPAMSIMNGTVHNASRQYQAKRERRQTANAMRTGSDSNTERQNDGMRNA